MKRRELARIALPVATARAVDAIYASMPTVRCRGKCVECCSPVGDLMTAFERDRITKATGKRPNGATDRAKGKKCNLLADGKCSVYEIRPVICRLWGADSKMPCRFGCDGANAIPAGEGSVFVRVVVGATEGYD